MEDFDSAEVLMKVPSDVIEICGDVGVKVAVEVSSIDFNVEIRLSNLFLLLSRFDEYVESEVVSSAEHVSTLALLIVEDWDLISSYFLIFVEIDVKLSTNKMKSAQDIAEDLWDLLLLLAEEIALVTLVIAPTIVSYLVIFVLISDWDRGAVVSDSEGTIDVVTKKDGEDVENIVDIFEEVVDVKTIGVRYTVVENLVDRDSVGGCETTVVI